MKRFMKNCKVGGGGAYPLELRSCEDLKTCYNSDMEHHCYSEPQNEVIRPITAACHPERKRRSAAFTLAEVFSPHPAGQRKCAFTLAEVLITLGIIGVVAVLSLSPLLQKYKEKEIVARLEKAYSSLDQAFVQAVSEYGTVDNWCSSEQLWDECSIKIFDRVTPYLKTVKVCEKSKKGCFATLYSTRFSTSNTTFRSYKHLVLADGMSVTFKAFTGDAYKSNWCQANKNAGAHQRFYNHCGYVYVDVNSLKGPNVVDIDLFAFKIFKDGISPIGHPADTVWTDSFNSQCLGNRFYSGYGCTAWIIMKKNMDYVHCPEKIGWDKAASCKD